MNNLFQSLPAWTHSFNPWGVWLLFCRSWRRTLLRFHRSIIHPYKIADETVNRLKTEGVISAALYLHENDFSLCRELDRIAVDTFSRTPPIGEIGKMLAEVTLEDIMQAVVDDGYVH